MSTVKDKNPLLAPQRETAGAITFGKYEYQYHWALFRALEEYSLGHEFVLFVELHEDVILGNSFSSTAARFEFNQIKNITSSPWTVKKITARPKGGKGDPKNSVIGKMLSGIDGRPFKEKIDILNLVATCGFKLKLQDESLNFSSLGVAHLHPECINAIEVAIAKELGVSTKLPSTLTFVTPELPAHGFHHYVVSKIAEVIDKKTSGVFANVSNVYRVLMDDLRKKGVVTADFDDWQDLIQKKGLTSLDIERVTNINSTIPSTAKISSEFDLFAAELKLHLGQRNILKRACEDYQQASRFVKSTVQLELNAEVKSLVAINVGVFQSDGVQAFLDAALVSASEKIKNLFQGEVALKGALIYELILLQI